MACRRSPTHLAPVYRFAAVLDQLVPPRAVHVPFPAGRSKASHKGIEHDIANSWTAGAQYIVKLHDHSCPRTLTAIQQHRYLGRKERDLVHHSSPCDIDLHRFPKLLPLHLTTQNSDRYQKEPSPKCC